MVTIVVGVVTTYAIVYRRIFRLSQQFIASAHHTVAILTQLSIASTIPLATFLPCPKAAWAITAPFNFHSKQCEKDLIWLDVTLQALRATWHKLVSIGLVTASLYCTLEYVLGINIVNHY